VNRIKGDGKMETLTKKQFAQLHKSGTIGLIASCWDKPLETIMDILSGISEFTTKPVSRVDIGDQGKYRKVVASTDTINGKRFWFLHTTYDNSQCDSCSWDSKQTNTVIYAAMN
jgi:hypothetical protein